VPNIQKSDGEQQFTPIPMLGETVILHMPGLDVPKFTTFIVNIMFPTLGPDCQFVRITTHGGFRSNPIAASRLIWDFNQAAWELTL